MKLFVLIVLTPLLAQATSNRLIENPGWQCVGSGSRQIDPGSGELSLRLSNDTADSSVSWRLDYPFKAGGLYEISATIRASNDASIFAILLGTDFFNKDLKARPEEQDEKVLFVVPDTPGTHYIRLGLWRSTGTVWFSNLVIRRVIAIPRTLSPPALGAGESIDKDHYQAYYYFPQLQTNFSRCLAAFSAGFNTSRWDLYAGDFVIYKHDLPGVQAGHKRASISLNVNYRAAGRLLVEASRDSVNWQLVAAQHQTGRLKADLPSSLFPADVVFLRLKAVGENARVQIDEYRFRSQLTTSFAAARGGMLLVKTDENATDISIDAVKIHENVFTARLRSHANKSIRADIVADAAGGADRTSVRLAPGKASTERLTLSADRGALQRVSIHAKGEKRPAVVIEDLADPYIEWDDYGTLLTSDEDAALWWTDGVRKIGKHRRPPSTTASGKIEMWCARNEYEPAQLVIAPQRDMTLTVSAGDLRHQNGRMLHSAISLYAVDYVTIQTPTDYSGSVGPWPDPLPPIESPLKLVKGENQPVWVLVYIPADAPSGDYEASLQVSLDGRNQRVPLVVHVWDFVLPKQTHLKTAFGFNASLISRYHHFRKTDRLDEILEKYFQNFARHRISPYDPFVLSPIKVSFDSLHLTARLNFAKFDKAYDHYIRELGFNTFRLPLQGCASGTYHSSRRGHIGSFQQGSPEYTKMMTDYLQQLEAHLRRLGALDKAYLYWFDEPEAKDYPFIRETMHLIADAAPGLTRMLTEQPTKELFGAVDLWCPKLPSFIKDVAKERRAQGEKLWWYICTTPKAPYPTLFIDHYAVELRTWMWQSWKYHLNGILVWSANYWTSPGVYPWPEYQNPWTDPMSYRSGGFVKPGERSYWGNGDGRFIYPPKQVFQSAQKNNMGPVSSIRWEMLREGLEDYEYLWLLQSRVARLEAGKGHRRLLKKARALLVVPDNITGSLTQFSKRPEPIFEHRRRVAEMILKLQSLN